MGLACFSAFTFLGVAFLARGLAIHLVYLLKLAILTCLLLPGVFGHLSHFGAHTLAGEGPATGIGKAFLCVGLLVISLIVTILVPVLQVSCLVIDTFIMFRSRRETLYERLEGGLSVHRWLLEHLRDMGDLF